MEDRETMGIQVPAAPLVWDAVEFAQYAQARLDSRKTNLLRSEIEENECRCGGHEGVITESMIEWVTEWVVTHARRDVLYLLEFTRQLKGLYEAINRAVSHVNEVLDSPEWTMPGESAIKCLCLFLVLRGEDATQAALEGSSTIASMIYDDVAVYDGDIVYGAAARLFEKPPHYRWNIGTAIADLFWCYPAQSAQLIKDDVLPWRWDELQNDRVYGPAIELLSQSHLSGRCGASEKMPTGI